MSTSTSMRIAADSAAHSLLQGIGAALIRAWRAYVRWRLDRWVAAELHTWGDRELKDIGLSRSGIEAAIRGPDPLTPHRLRGRHF